MASRSSSKKTTSVPNSDLLLIVDDRERAVFPHLHTEAADINYSIKRIEIGDYAVVDTVLNKIIAVFERKTLEDLASSLKDGRYENKTKMINLRGKTGCALFYILEGPISPKPNSYFGGISYANLESAIYHMMVRDNIMLINTLNTLDTVSKLIRFYKSMVSLANKPAEIVLGGAKNEVFEKGTKFPAAAPNEAELPVKSPNTADKPNDIITEENKTNGENRVNSANIANANETNGVNSLTNVTITPPTTNHLTLREAKSDKDILREMWSVFRGITVVSADMFLTHWTIADIIQRCIDLTKLPKGVKINRSVIKSLSSIDKRTEERLLSAIPGISESTAKQLLMGRTLRQLLTYEAGAISIICVGKAQKKLGETKANNIKKYMFMFYDTAANKCAVRASAAPTLDSVKLAESREEAIGRLLKL